MIDIIKELQSFNCNVEVYDPWASEESVKKEYNLDLIKDKINLSSNYDSVVMAVSHNEFLGINISKYVNKKHVIFDVKGILPKKHQTNDFNKLCQKY